MAIDHTVVQGEYLSRIARNYGLPHDPEAPEERRPEARLARTPTCSSRVIACSLLTRSDKTRRDDENHVNRRVVVLLFRPGAKLVAGREGRGRPLALPAREAAHRRAPRAILLGCRGRGRVRARTAA